MTKLWLQFATAIGLLVSATSLIHVSALED